MSDTSNPPKSSTVNQRIADLVAKLVTRETHKGSVNRVRHQATAQLSKLLVEARISELTTLRPPEQYKDYARLAGKENCAICGFNSEVFRRHIDDRISQLTKEGSNDEQAR